MSDRKRHGNPMPRRGTRGRKSGWPWAWQRTSRAGRQQRTTAKVVFGSLGVGAFGLALAALLWVSDGRAPAPPEPSPSLFGSMPVTAGLPPPGPSTPVPVNSVDRFTGNPIAEASPTLTYKGHVVAFCCEHSPGYSGGWERLTEAQKDTYVRSFLK